MCLWLVLLFYHAVGGITNLRKPGAKLPNYTASVPGITVFTFIKLFPAETVLYTNNETLFTTIVKPA